MDIYEPPKADLGKSGNGGGLIVCTIVSILAALIYLAIVRMIPDFAETFQSFGADLPGLTRLVLSVYPLFSVLAIFSIALNVVWLVNVYKPNWVERIRRISLYNVLLSVVCFFVSLISMYLPIFQLGQVV